jgi:xylulokinase
MTLVAGADCSTQSTKVVVVDADSGEVVATGRAQHTVTGSGGARETHPDVWWEALRGALEQTGLAGQIVAISVAGQQHGLVCLDSTGRPLRPAMLWNDTRSATDAVRLVEALGGATTWALGLVSFPWRRSRPRSGPGFGVVSPTSRTERRRSGCLTTT